MVTQIIYFNMKERLALQIEIKRITKQIEKTVSSP